MNYDLVLLAIWLVCCSIAFALLWLWLKVDEIVSNEDKIRSLQFENSEIKKKMSQLEDLVLKNVGKRR